MADFTPQVFDHLFDGLKTSEITSALLVDRARASGAELTLEDLKGAIDAHRLRGVAISLQDWRLLLALQVGNLALKAREAFAVLDQDGDGWVQLDALKRLIKVFEVSEQIADAIAIEIARDGSERINLQHLLDYLPDQFESHPRAYVGAHRSADPHAAVRHEALRGNDASKSQLTNLQGTSPLQMQIGWFRLIQGAAYRSFRESYSANSETHLRAYDLPYTISDFVRFVNASIDLFLALGIVEGGAEEPFESLRTSVNNAEVVLRDRMANWNSIPHNEAMLEAEGRLEQELQELDKHHQILAVVIELVLTAALHGHKPDQVTHEDLQSHELNRLRQLDDHQEVTAALDHDKQATSRPYHDSWQRVIFDADDQRFAGSIMPTAYWYDEFMPLLLRASAVLNRRDISAWDEADDDALNSWFAERHAAGEFDLYGHATEEAFHSRPLTVKKVLKRAWELTRHYLNGVQKRREREEFGRESGFLCQYVAFLDLHVGRHDVEASEMRVSFPYYIGPSTWRFMHTSAELIAAQPSEQQKDSVAVFKAFFSSLATMYPCPYCRFHLNRYVVRNREVSMYPIEYLLLGSDKASTNLEVSLQDKLCQVNDGNSLRLFLWKLHNTVSSSIARSEDWYHQDSGAYYTSRYWPSLDSELERAHTLGIDLIQRDRVQRIYGVVKSAAHLSVLRDELQVSLHANDLEQQEIIRTRAVGAVGAVEEAVLQSRFLHENYRYNPDLELEPPHFSSLEEVLARSGKYTEN
ncbi:Erv1/Alr family FAD-linked sulfhydryl oxidase [Synechococcus sp. AH-601-J22]|nr:Erv1/Alr family FAD-linked sulfhydryl oxidase [Synechococcus sp. AH-601-J22]